MGVAADCEYTNSYGGQANATQQILTDWNTASALYKVGRSIGKSIPCRRLIMLQSTFNISLGIIELQIQNSTCVVSTFSMTFR